MLSLSAFRSLSISPVATQALAIRSMATKAAAAAAAAAPKKPKSKAEESSSKSTKATKATKTTKAKTTKETKTKKVAAPKEKPKKIQPLELPKRPISPWSLFYMDHLSKVKASGKAIVPTKETAAAAIVWHELPSAQKLAYEDKYKASREKYEKDLKQRLNELTPEEFKLENARRQALRAAGKKSLPRLKDPSAPKRPLSSFFRFAQDLRQSGKYADLPQKEQTKIFGTAWAEASKTEKDRYNELARVALEKYKAEKAAYERKA